MKLHSAIVLALLQLSAVSGATFTIPEDDDPIDSSQGSNISDLFSKFGLYNDEKAEAIKMAAQAATEALDKRMETIKAKELGEAFRLVDQAKDRLRAEYDDIDVETTKDKDSISEALVDFGDTMKACDKHDCKRKYFFKEMLRWVKKALIDTGVFIYENPKATAALFIGATVLVANLINSGALLPAALEVIGFGTKGPIAGSIAAAIQRNMGAVNVGSVFAQLQSAAMRGASLPEIDKMANVAFAALSAAGAASLIGAGSKPLGLATDFEQVEWKTWEKTSRIDYTPELMNKMSHLWGVPTAEGCVEYGHREYRAPIWFVPHGLDPVSVCLQTPAAIQGIGFKSPLGCTDQGPKKGVIGTWYVQSNETTCMPHWSQLEDEGCMQYGKRRMFARLLGLRRQDDWNSMCETTPAHVRDQGFDGPTYCEDKGVLGIFGIFDIADEKCECYCTGA
ncbi:hypothetical protein BDV93DRAFT_520241 [Ceratobasidium sp. AG-I]|nr:hypothetical protein BDV93DRAFT_520241 [Ceratobasidium sp. AG-I]